MRPGTEGVENIKSICGYLQQVDIRGKYTGCCHVYTPNDFFQLPLCREFNTHVPHTPKVFLICKLSCQGQGTKGLRVEPMEHNYSLADSMNHKSFRSTAIVNMLQYIIWFLRRCFI